VGASGLGFYSGLVLAAADPHQLNLPEPQSVIAQQIYDMHTMLLWICLVTRMWLHPAATGVRPHAIAMRLRG
jgi:hypothetical protein